MLIQFERSSEISGDLATSLRSPSTAHAVPEYAGRTGNSGLEAVAYLEFGLDVGGAGRLGFMQNKHKLRLFNITTVSYTHLDVYKRQSQQT